MSAETASDYADAVEHALYVGAITAPLPEAYVTALGEIGKLADQFKADEITAIRFTVRVGVILSDLSRGGV